MRVGLCRGKLVLAALVAIWRGLANRVFLTAFFSQLDMVTGNLVEQALACQAGYAGCLGTVAA